MSTHSKPVKTPPAAETPERTLVRIREAKEELDELIKTANGVLGDLRREVKQAERITVDTMTARLDEELKKVLEGLGNVTANTLKEVTDVVFKRFDSMADELLGEDGRSVPLADLFRTADAKKAVREAAERLGFEFQKAILSDGEQAIVLTKDGKLV